MANHTMNLASNLKSVIRSEIYGSGGWLIADCVTHIHGCVLCLISSSEAPLAHRARHQEVCGVLCTAEQFVCIKSNKQCSTAYLILLFLGCRILLAARL